MKKTAPQFLTITGIEKCNPKNIIKCIYLIMYIIERLIDLMQIRLLFIDMDNRGRIHFLKHKRSFNYLITFYFSISI